MSEYRHPYQHRVFNPSEPYPYGYDFDRTLRFYEGYFNTIYDEICAQPNMLHPPKETLVKSWLQRHACALANGNGVYAYGRIFPLVNQNVMTNLGVELPGEIFEAGTVYVSPRHRNEGCTGEIINGIMDQSEEEAPAERLLICTSTEPKYLVAWKHRLENRPNPYIPGKNYEPIILHHNRTAHVASTTCTCDQPGMKGHHVGLEACPSRVTIPTEESLPAQIDRTIIFPNNPDGSKPCWMLASDRTLLYQTQEALEQQVGDPQEFIDRLREIGYYN